MWPTINYVPFFAIVNQKFVGSSQLPTTAEHCLVLMYLYYACSLTTNVTKETRGSRTAISCFGTAISVDSRVLKSARSHYWLDFNPTGFFLGQLKTSKVVFSLHSLFFLIVWFFFKPSGDATDQG